MIKFACLAGRLHEFNLVVLLVLADEVVAVIVGQTRRLFSAAARCLVAQNQLVDFVQEIFVIQVVQDELVYILVLIHQVFA
jgi:hypothetical protein